MRIDAVLIDIDDTLVDTRARFADAIGAVARRFLPHLDAAGRVAATEHWRNDIAGHYLRYTRGETTARQQRRERAALLHAAFGGPELSDELFAEWDRVFIAARDARIRVFDDVAAFLAGLGATGTPCGALTNADERTQKAKLEAAGLAQLPLLVTLDTLGVGKPDPAVFREGVRRLGAEAGRTVYIGDEPEIDALGAARAGLIGVWLERPGRTREKERAVDRPALADAGVVTVPSLADVGAMIGAPGRAAPAPVGAATEGGAA